MIQQVYDEGLIESPESLYSAFSKVSHGKAARNATKYWTDKIENILPDLPERRKERPEKIDFLSVNQFDEKVEKYQKASWEIFDTAPKLDAGDVEEAMRAGLDAKMKIDIDNQVRNNFIFQKNYLEKYSIPKVEYSVNGFSTNENIKF